MKYAYHATPDKNAVVMSCDQPVAGWLAPSVGIGSCVAGEAETVMTTEDAAAFIKQASSDGHQIVRGKDISSNGLFALRNDISKKSRQSHK